MLLIMVIADVLTVASNSQRQQSVSGSMLRDRFGEPDRDGLIHGVVLQAVLPRAALPPEADVFNASTDVC